LVNLEADIWHKIKMKTKFTKSRILFWRESARQNFQRARVNLAPRAPRTYKNTSLLRLNETEHILEPTWTIDEMLQQYCWVYERKFSTRIELLSGGPGTCVWVASGFFIFYYCISKILEIFQNVFFKRNWS